MMLKDQISFNDGIAEIYTVHNAAKSGDRPADKLMNKRTVRFAFRTVGAVRFYMAKQADVEIDLTISIPRGVHVSPQDVVIIPTEQVGANQQYDIKQVQPNTKTKPHSVLLTLQRRAESYDIA